MLLGDPAVLHPQDVSHCRALGAGLLDEVGVHEDQVVFGDDFKLC